MSEESACGLEYVDGRNSNRQRIRDFFIRLNAVLKSLFYNNISFNILSAIKLY